MERKGYQLFSSNAESVSIAMKMKKGTRSVVTTTRLVICASLPCVYFCNCSSLATGRFDSFTSHLYIGFHTTFLCLRFLCRKLIPLIFRQLQLFFFSFNPTDFFQICSVKLFSIHACSIDLLCNVSDLRKSTRLEVSLFKKKKIWGLKLQLFIFLSCSDELDPLVAFTRKCNTGLDNSRRLI